jgi:hypothetical protein
VYVCFFAGFTDDPVSRYSVSMSPFPADRKRPDPAGIRSLSDTVLILYFNPRYFVQNSSVTNIFFASL